MSIVRDLKNKKAVEFAGIKFDVREYGFQFGTIGVFRLSMCEYMGEVHIHIYCADRSCAHNGRIATNRKVARLCAKQICAIGIIALA